MENVTADGTAHRANEEGTSGTSPVPTGRHDPEGRRRQIVLAAAELIPDVGLAKLTHRLVAQRAGVSLGATTRYFASLDELRSEALRVMAELLEADLATTRATLEAEGCTPQSLTKDLMKFLHDRELVRISVELISAANADPTLRPLANIWTEGLVELLSPVVGPIVARGASLVMDGAAVHASINDEPLDGRLVERIFGALLKGGDPASSPE